MNRGHNNTETAGWFWVRFFVCHPEILIFPSFTFHWIMKKITGYFFFKLSCTMALKDTKSLMEVLILCERN